MKKTIFTVFVFLAFSINVYAACNNEILVNEAKDVKVSARPQESEEGDLYFLIEIDEIKNNMALVISSDYDDLKETYKYNDTKKGLLTIKDSNIYTKNTYTIRIYSLDSSCQNMLLETKHVATIKFNDYAKYDVCDGNEEFDLCKPFYDGEIASKEVFNNALEEYKKESSKTFFDKVFEYVKEYYLYVLIPILVITIGYYGYLGIVNWRKRRK